MAFSVVLSDVWVLLTSEYHVGRIVPDAAPSAPRRYRPSANKWHMISSKMYRLMGGYNAK